LGAWFAFAAFAVVLVRSAWMCDDAYITLRTVDNFVRGHGLVWNAAERVQTYTHPLWALLLSGVYALTREPYFTTLALSLATALAAALLVVRALGSKGWSAPLVLLSWILSKALVDYSTSGLENPLSHLLLVAFVLSLKHSTRADDRALLLQATLAALAVTTRFDLVLLVAPALAWSWWNSENRRLWPLALGLAPLAAWICFALFYYGFALPNTAYAKEFSTAIPRVERVEQGLAYLANSLRLDPLTLPLTIGGALFALVVDRRAWPLAVGVLAHVAYVVWVGGDFMSGRFLTCAFVVSSLLVVGALAHVARRSSLAFASACVALGALAPVPTVFAGSRYADVAFDRAQIANERGYYFQASGLLAAERMARAPWGETPWVYGEKLMIDDRMGVLGYQQGASAFIVDRLAVTDPLLARLPIHGKQWRAGHVPRRIPRGYLRTLWTGINGIENPQLAAYYDHLCALTRGPLWSWKRLAEIARFNCGAYDGLLASYVAGDYRSVHKVDVAKLAVERPIGTPWYADGLTEIDSAGTWVCWSAPSHAARIALSFDENDQYIAVFRSSGKRVAKVGVGKRHVEPASRGLERFVIEVPAAAREGGFDVLELEPTGGDGLRALGDVHALDD
jgi:arabinofuranosyltransferase